MTALFKLFSVLPLWFLHAMGWAMGWLAFALSPTYRRRFMENAAQAGYRFSQVAASVGQAGRMVTELPRLWLGTPLRYEWDNAACIDSAFGAGRGILFLTPHMGCFEIAPQAMAHDYSPRHGPMTILYRPARQPWLANVMAAARQRPGLQTAPTTLAGVRQMIKALRQGQAVGMLPDQVPPEGLGLWALFFGREAYTMTLAARLVQQTGARVLVAWSERRSWGRGFLVHVRELAEPLSSDLGTAVAQINAEMERLIRERPEQYLWGYARYKRPRKEI
ncbi:MAG TPA: lysophospholipid acyltransferase family protein [Burkholderiaceae bacterium]|nr:lysophospholipid acyltransferase family protein [Burkholderiaceae bacterium]